VRVSEAIERLRQEFLGEAEETLSAFRADILRLGETAPASFPEYQLVDRVFRTAHSLKGVLGMFGFEEMARVSHALENVLDRIRSRALFPHPEIIDLLLEGNETLHALLAHAVFPPGDPHPRSESILARINEVLAAEPLELAPAEDPLALALVEISSTETAALRSALDAGDSICVVEIRAPFTEGSRPFEVVRAVRTWGGIHAIVEAPSNDGTAPALRLLASGKAGFFALAKVVGAYGAEVLPCEADRVLSQVREPVASAARPLPPASHPAPDAANAPTNTLRVRLERIDRLLASLAELLQAKMSLDAAVEHASSAPHDRMRRTDLAQSLRALGRKISGLQEEILEVRLVSLNTLVPKLERAVWSAAKECGKNAKLVVTDLDVEVDKEVVDALLPALVHLARNAVDHGLEHEDDRVARGKDRTGVIRLQARSNGRFATIEVSDDGAGIDFDRILAQARERGLLPSDGELSRQEILEVLFHPGFSTKSEASSVSGRGVGLDVVRDVLSNLGGGLEVDMQESGTLFRLRVPTTLAILPGLLVTAGGQSFVLPTAALTQVIKIRPSQVEKKGEGEIVRVDGRELPAIDLGSTLGIAAVDRSGARILALVLSCAGRSAAVLVDAVGTRRDVVTQGLGFVRSEIPGVVGSTELGDGKTVLLLDAAAILEAGRPRNKEAVR
jgi:two-component system chemotaxis sensor kinase CheA